MPETFETRPFPAALPLPTADPTPQHLLVTDEDLAQSLCLLPDLPPGYDMLIVPRSAAPLSLLTDHLQTCAPLGTLLLVLNGGPGYLRLGGQILDQAALERHQGELERWQSLLAQDICLMVLADGLTENSSGDQFTRLFRQLVQRPVLFLPRTEIKRTLSALSVSAFRNAIRASCGQHR